MQKITALFSFYSKKKLGEYSAQASYYLILSIFPFIMLLLTLLTFIPVDYKTFLNLLQDYISPQFLTALSSSVEDFFNSNNLRTTIFTAVFTLWSVSKSTSSLMRGLNNMYEVQETRHFIMVKINAILNTLLLGLMILASISLVIQGHRLVLFSQRYFPNLTSLINAVLDVRLLLFYIILISFTTLMYKLLPNRKIPIIYEIPGAVFTTLGWYAFTGLFGLYVNHASGYYLVYGSLTAIFLSFVWIYICIHILYIGAGINLFLERRFHHAKSRSRIKK